MDYRQRFLESYEQFKITQLWNDMVATVENSPWHREANVAVHTEMVVDQFLSNTDDITWSKDHFKGAMACLFHDIGKPESKEEAYSEERGNYVRFHGHEMVSARLAEDYFVTYWLDFNDVLEPFDIYAIGWMIEHHLPFGVKKQPKQMNIRSTALYINPTDPTVFETVLVSDQKGRISDDEEVKAARYRDWAQDYQTWPTTPTVEDTGQPRLTMLIGCSSCGKSTFASLYPEATYFSWDQMRLEKYPMPKSLLIGTVSEHERYNYAWQMSCEDSSFYSDSLKYFNELVRKGGDIVVDNMNLSEKRRRQFAEVAARKGYFVEMILFPVSFEQLKTRDTQRGDRELGFDTIRDMYMRISYPMMSPYCHKVSVYNGNLPK